MSYMPPQHRTLGFNDLVHIQSAEELYALAAAVEAEAFRRYDQLHRAMVSAGDTTLAQLFDYLREQEQSHQDRVSQMSHKAGVIPASALKFTWDSLPEGDLPETADTLAPSTILRHALRNEQRTYALFLRIAAQTSRLDVREHAESLAAEELEHVALLTRHGLDLAAEPPATVPFSDRQRSNIDALRSLASSEARISASRRASLATLLRSKGDRSSASLMQDLAEISEERNRALGGAGFIPTPRTGFGHFAHSGLASNDNQTPTHLLRAEMRTTELSACGFLHMASQLGTNGLSAFANHEADLRMAMMARLTDRIAVLEAPPPQP